MERFMRKKSDRIVVLLLLAVIFAASGCTMAPKSSAPRAKYVFLMIGDGMGLSQRVSAELYLNAQIGRASCRERV
mgnify:CR=1 FL=1